MEDFNAANREWMRVRLEDQKKAAEGARDAWIRSLRDIRNEMNNTFGNDQANSLSQLSAQFQVGGIVAQAAINRIYTEGVG